MSYRGEGATFVGVDGAPPLPLPDGVSGGAGLPKSWPRMTEEVWWPHARATNAWTSGNASSVRHRLPRWSFRKIISFIVSVPVLSVSR